MIKLAVLGLLKEQPLHGYELKKRLGEVLGRMSRVSFGSLYPALRKLETSGAVEVIDADDEQPIPMTGSLSGEAAAFRARRTRPTGRARGRRGKKVYAITPAGEQLFAELLASPADDDRSFSLKLTFGRHLAPEARLRLLERRRAELVERLDVARTTMRADDPQLDIWTRSLVEHDTETTERDLEWIDRLIEAEGPAPAASSDLSAGGTS
jgi:DNA-binding PadR family transcriptional regulator